MTSKMIDSNHNESGGGGQALAVAPEGGIPIEQGGGLALRATPGPLVDRSARLDSLFSQQGPPDLSSDEDVAIANTSTAPGAAVNQRQLLTFSLDREEYALDIEAIREIIKPREITEIPRAPEHVLGILSLRGQVIPVYDLKRRLRLGCGAISTTSRIVVCQHEDQVAGLLVDGITQVVRIARDGVEATPANMAGIDRSLLLGVGRCQGRFLILLNLPNIIDAGLN